MEFFNKRNEYKCPGCGVDMDISRIKLKPLCKSCGLNSIIEKFLDVFKKMSDEKQKRLLEKMIIIHINDDVDNMRKFFGFVLNLITCGTKWSDIWP